MTHITPEQIDNHVNKLNIYEYQLILEAAKMSEIPEDDYKYYGTKFIAVISTSVARSVLKCRALITLVLRARNYTYDEICNVVTAKNTTWAASRLNDLNGFDIIRKETSFMNQYKELIKLSDEFYLKSTIYDKKV